MAALLVAAATFFSSAYSQRVLNATELVHFFVPFPAGRVTRPQALPRPGGRPIFVRPIVIDAGRRGLLKRLIDPGLEGLSTHWLVNLDSRPHRIGLRFTNVDVPLRWEVGAGLPWDPETKTFKAALGPGESVPDLGIDWIFEFSEERRARDVWYDGTLVVFDADSGEELTIIPVRFLARRKP